MHLLRRLHSLAPIAFLGRHPAAAIVGGVLVLCVAAALLTVLLRPRPHAAVLPILDPPVLAENFPDPFVLATKGGFLAFATQSRGVHVQVAGSVDLEHWAILRNGLAPVDALPTLPAWVRPDRPDVWAPEVMRIGARYVLYFSARSREQRHTDGEKECIGAAISPDARGPFKPLDMPLVCDGLPSGAIDPSPFRDGRKLYLYFKRDGNCCGRGSGILVQDLAPDGLSVHGARVRTGVRNDRPWEGEVVEAPSMLKRRGRYLMFFSGAYYNGTAYAIGYAACRSPTGHCQDAPENPILASRQATPPRLIGPGHQSLLTVGGRTFIAYHAWKVRPDGSFGGARQMHISEVRWVQGRPQIGGLIRPLPVGASPASKLGQGATLR